MLSARCVRDARERGIVHGSKCCHYETSLKTWLRQRSPTSRRYNTFMHIEFPKKHDEKAIEYDYLSVVNAMLHFCDVSRSN